MSYVFLCNYCNVIYRQYTVCICSLLTYIKTFYSFKKNNRILLCFSFKLSVSNKILIYEVFHQGFMIYRVAAINPELFSSFF
jgi:hypothetical protein